MIINPQRLEGNWEEGWILDKHTLFTISIEPELNIHEYVRSPIAEELYLLKYKNEHFRIETIARAASDFLKTKNWSIDELIPIPSTSSTFSSVYEIANSIGKLAELKVDTSALKRTDTIPLNYEISESLLSGKDVLIFDETYDTGKRIKTFCDVVRNKGKARRVYVLVVTEYLLH